MMGEWVAFSITAAVILVAAVASTLAQRTFHSVIFLGVVLIAVAALFVVLEAPFLGAIQILVYVGGILTLFVFAVMFVVGDEEEVST